MASLAQNGSEVENNPMTHPLRVAYLTAFVPPYRVELFSRLASRLQDFQIFTSVEMEPNRDWAASYEALNITRQRNFTINRTWRHPQGFDDALYVQFPYDTVPQLRRFAPDVIISDELGFRTLQTLIARGLLSNCGLVAWTRMTDHTEQGRGRMRQMLRRFIVPKIDAFFVHGEGAKRYFRSLGVRDAHLFAVKQAVDVDKFLRGLDRLTAHPPRVLLHTGQISARKGLMPFLEPLCRWAQEHPQTPLELRFVGRGPLQAEIEAYPRPDNLTITMMGPKPYDQLPQIYADADILIYPTLADCWGLVVNEAMAAGVPILGSAYSEAVEELVVEGRNGWIFKPDDQQTIYQAIDRALTTSPEDLLQMRRDAQADIEDITLDHVLAQLLQAIQFAHNKRSA